MTVQNYILENSLKESELLNELHATTLLKHRGSNMISGPEQGRFLSWISQLIKPKRILELGTFTGYSALCLAEGLQPEGRLITIERDETVLNTARYFFNRSVYADRIISLSGNIQDHLIQQQGPFDLIFMDADKKAYRAYAEALIPLIKSGGLFISDNVLWKERVVSSQPDAIAQSMIDYNAFLNSHPQLKVFILNMRDGLSLAQKK